MTTLLLIATLAQPLNINLRDYGSTNAVKFVSDGQLDLSMRLKASWSEMSIGKFKISPSKTRILVLITYNGKWKFKLIMTLFNGRAFVYNNLIPTIKGEEYQVMWAVNKLFHTNLRMDGWIRDNSRQLKRRGR